MKATVMNLSEIKRTLLIFARKALKNTALVSAFVSFICSGLISYYFAAKLQDDMVLTTVKTDHVNKFTANADQLIKLGGEYIQAVNSNEETKSIEKNIRAFSSDQLLLLEDIEQIFGPSIYVSSEKYELTLQTWLSTFNRNPTVSHMKKWMESYGGVIDTRITLVQEMYLDTGIYGKN